MTNCEKWPRNIAPVAVWNPDSRTRAPGNTGDAAARSTRINTMSIGGEAASSASTGREVQPMAWPRRKPIIRQSKSERTRAEPARSNLGLELAAVGEPNERGIENRPTPRARAARGRRPANTAGQSNRWTKGPAARVEVTMPRARLAEVNPMERPRRCSGNTDAAMAGAVL